MKYISLIFFGNAFIFVFSNVASFEIDDVSPACDMNPESGSEIYYFNIFTFCKKHRTKKVNGLFQTQRTQNLCWNACSSLHLQSRMIHVSCENNNKEERRSEGERCERNTNNNKKDTPYNGRYHV